MDKIIQILDFLPGQKTTIGAVCFVLGYFGHTIDPEALIGAITGIATAVGAVVSAYGLVMKVVRQYQK